MLPKAQMRVVGFRWTSSRGQGACEACAALHGQEFYFEPGPGQRDAADAPEPPLHPYCKCRLDDIVRYEFNTENENEGTAHETHETTHPSIKPYMEDVTRNPVWRIIVRNNGSDWTPIWGKYCGKNWSNGRDTGVAGTQPSENSASEDSLDAACWSHDLCYDEHEKIYCDKMLIKNLEYLAGDPARWSYPPNTEEEADYAAAYRAFALFAFRILVAARKFGINPN